jgi:arylsulfatase A-like enzyme
MEITSTMDILPTLLQLTGSSLPPTAQIDGEDISMLLDSPEEPVLEDRILYYYSAHGHPQAIRMAEWKYSIRNGREELFNIQEDIGEKYDLSDSHPELMEQLRSRLLLFDRELESEQRPVGTLNN